MLFFPFHTVYLFVSFSCLTFSFPIIIFAIAFSLSFSFPFSFPIFGYSFSLLLSLALPFPFLFPIIFSLFHVLSSILPYQEYMWINFSVLHCCTEEEGKKKLPNSPYDNQINIFMLAPSVFSDETVQVPNS